MKMIFKNYVAFVAVAMLGGMISLGGYKLLFENDHSDRLGFIENKVPVQLTGLLPANTGSTDFTFAAEVTTPAVVHVKSNFIVQTRSNPFFGTSPFNDLFNDDWFYGRPQQREMQSSGSGVITTPDGYIVTNNHVIKDAQSVDVVLEDGRTFEAEVVGSDPSTDIALLKIKADDLPYIPFGNSDDLKIGEWVLAVGNPFNLTSTVTAGIVSAKARNIHILKDKMAIESFIQTDAAVNPGNSGGALVNSRGELVGINTAIASKTGSYSGYSFAVPIEIVKKVIGDLMAHGIVQRAFLGADMIELNGEIASQLGTTKTQGVYIGDVFEGGSAEKAGIRKGDIIIGMNGKSLRNAAELSEYLGRQKPGDKVKLTVLRGDQEKDVMVELMNSNGTTDLIRKEKGAVLQSLGAEFEELGSQELAKLNLRGGVKVSRINSGKLREYTDIRPGFIITGIDNRAIRKVEDIEKTLDGKAGGVMIEGIYPDRPGVYYYAFGM